MKLVEPAGLAHSIIVHPEPYQDDHRYLEYCFAHEPRQGYFRGTCLFDPLRAELRRQITDWSGARIDVVPAALGDDSVLYGALALAEEL